MSKTFQAAIIIQPPLDQWQQIQTIRKAHDKAYQRWMPHVGCAIVMAIRCKSDSHLVDLVD